MTHEEILKAARERLAEIGKDPAHDKERESLLTIVHGTRCQFCRQYECATKRVMAHAAEPVLFNGVPCMMGSGSTLTTPSETDNLAARARDHYARTGTSRLGDLAFLSVDVADYDRA